MCVVVCFYVQRAALERVNLGQNKPTRIKAGRKFELSLTAVESLRLFVISVIPKISMYDVWVSPVAHHGVLVHARGPHCFSGCRCNRSNETESRSLTGPVTWGEADKAPLSVYVYVCACAWKHCETSNRDTWICNQHLSKDR